MYEYGKLNQNQIKRFPDRQSVEGGDNNNQKKKKKKKLTVVVLGEFRFFSLTLRLSEKLVKYLFSFTSTNDINHWIPLCGFGMRKGYYRQEREERQRKKGKSWEKREGKDRPGV